MDSLDARVICPDNIYPPSHDVDEVDDYTVYITVNVVRKSDGTVSPFMPRCALWFVHGFSFNNPGHLSDGEALRWFDANPLLRGYVPWAAQIPYHRDGIVPLDEGTQLNTLRDLPDCTKQYLLGASQWLNTLPLTARVPCITCELHFGSLADLPY